ncbi:MAG: hypothetical protein R2839_00475 [Thermomicrobiales bacterium]
MPQSGRRFEQNRFHYRAFLASDLSGAISGETIFVDNGFHAVGMMPLDRD